MILLLDVGNTRLKWTMAEAGRLQHVQSEAHGGDPARLFFTLALPPAEQVWIAQVMGVEHERRLTEAVQSHYGFVPQFAHTEADYRGLRPAYAEPARLGVDRWLAMLALWCETQQPFCVVNAGTALTFDAVDEGGQHLGGLIAPGLVTAEKAVLDATRFATRPATVRYGAGLGRDTESCVRQGAIHACAGLIERAARQAVGARYISGGDAASLLPHIGGGRSTGPAWQWRPHLVLEGLLALGGSGDV